MKALKFFPLALALGLLFFATGGVQEARLTVVPTGTGFTYQGRLMDGGAPANGLYDFEFKLYGGEGNVAAEPIRREDLPVQQGLFAVELDFGPAAFNGDERSLGVGVRPGSSLDSFTELFPWQRLTAAPYATFAKKTPWSGVTGVPQGFADGVDNDTLYSAGAGLSLSGTTFSIAPGQVVKSLNSLKDEVTLTAGSGVTITPSGNTLTIAATPSSGTCPPEPTAKWSSLVQDGQVGSQYTFISVLNTGSSSHTVTVSFYSKSGAKITDYTGAVAPGQAWQVATGTAGGIPATRGMDGYAKITTTGTLSELVPWGAVIFPSGGTFSGFTMTWVSK